MKHLTRILCIGLAALTFAACEEETTPTTPDTPDTFTVGALVLNEGNMGGNNASLTAFDLASGDVDNDWFEKANGRGLGDQAQDIVRYGSKVYVTVTESNSLEVVDPTSGASRRVDMGSRKPRSMAADGGKLYITCYDRTVVRVDTATLAIDATCPLGNYKPEGIAIAGGKAFVASGYNDSYEYDSVLYVIDLATFANPQTLTVGCNPSRVEKLDDGHIVVSWIGNYTTLAAGTAIVDAATLGVTTIATGATRMAVWNGTVYAFDAPYGGTVTWKTIAADGTVGPFPFTPALDGDPYCISINPANGDIVIGTDGHYVVNGDIYCFQQDGTRRYKAEVGLLPSKVVFL